MHHIWLLKQGRAPFYLIHFVTERCSANCRHCFLQRDKHVKELTLDEIIEFTRKTDRLLFVFLTGGEPFLRRDLSEIAIAYHKNTGVQKIQCPTNGSFPDRAVAFAREVSGKCPKMHTSITVSFDAVGKKHDESRRTPGLFEKTVETFRRLQSEEKHLSNFNVNATTTVSAFNQDSLGELYRFLVEELNCTNYFNTLVRGKPREPETADVDIDKFVRFNQMLERGMREKKFRGYRRFPFADFVNAKNLISRRLIAKTAREKRYFTPCYAGKIAGVIFSGGDVFPCELLDESFGNLRDFNYDLLKIWQSDQAESIRKKIHQTRCFCTHECFTTLNILFNMKYLWKLMWITAQLKISDRKPGS